jgi:thiol-disulfide isomerase/thioredoxin
MREDRPVRPLRALTVALVTATSACPLLGAAEKPAWPANTQVVEARLAPPDGSFDLRLPQLRVYDAEGRQLLDLEGYSSDGGRAIARALEGKLEAKDAHPLAGELARVTASDGAGLAPLPAADFTIVKWWAEWCVPCHAQSRDLAKVLAAHPDVRANLVHVDADFSKGAAQRVSIDDLPPVVAARLRDPRLNRQQKEQILADAVKAHLEKERQEKEREAKHREAAARQPDRR